jgi:hypothetical protein
MADAYPIIAWDNSAIEDGTLTSNPGDATGWPKENVKDWRPYLPWIASGTTAPWLKIANAAHITASCVGIVGHNLLTCGAASVVLAGSNNDAAWTTVKTIAITNNLLIFATFPSVTYHYWRLSITTPATAPQIGVWFLGTYLQFTEYPEPGFTPDGREHKNESSVSQTGNLLGVARKYIEREINMPMGYLDRAWVETYLQPCIDGAGAQPVILAHDVTNHPAAAYLVRFSDTKFKDAIDSNMKRVDLNFMGVKE